MSQKTIAIQARRVLPEKGRAPEAAHQFGFSRVGTDIVLEVGHFDVTELSGRLGQAQQQQAESVQIELTVSHRFVLTPQSALSLFETAQKLILDLQNSGMIKFGDAPLSVKTPGMD